MEILGLLTISETQFKKVKNLSNEAKANFTFTKAVYFSASFIIARAVRQLSLDEIRQFYKELNGEFDLPVCLYLSSSSAYAVRAMVNEGIAFYAEGRFVFLPFLSMLGKNYRDQPVIKKTKISFVCQHLILAMIFRDQRSVSVTTGAELIGVSKMSISKAFDELEALQLPIRTQGKMRYFRWDLPWGMLLKNTLPKMSSPIKEEFRLSEEVPFSGYFLSGISSLSMKTSLGDNVYRTIAVPKTSTELKKLQDVERLPGFEKPAQIVTSVHYVVPYGDGSSVDPVSAWLSLPENYPTDARVRFEVGRLFAREVDGWDSSWPLV